LRNRSRVESNARADPEAGDASHFRQLEDSDARHGQPLGEFGSGDRVRNPFDLVSQGSSVGKAGFF
jgi:hypothetical protein